MSFESIISAEVPAGHFKNLEGSTVLTAAPDAEAYTNDIVTAAHALLEAMGIDIDGADFAPIDLTLTEGGA